MASFKRLEVLDIGYPKNENSALFVCLTRKSAIIYPPLF